MINIINDMIKYSNHNFSNRYNTTDKILVEDFCNFDNGLFNDNDSNAIDWTTMLRFMINVYIMHCITFNMHILYLRLHVKIYCYVDYDYFILI